MMKKLMRKLFCIALPLFLLLFAYKTTLFFTELSPQQQETVDFLQQDMELTLNYTSSELSHLEDVKEVMNWMEIAFYVLLLICTLIVTYYKRNKKMLKNLLRCGGVRTVIAVLLFLAIAYFSFDFLFTGFHQLFFPQGNWLFPADSLLIQTFPLEFFISISTPIFVQTLILGILFIVLAHYLNK
jgi:integral membrane protein (TIGR01906 family)